MNHEELEQTCKDICPRCKAGEPLRQRDDTIEWVHDFHWKGGYTHAFCLASHYRNKYKDSISG